MKTSTKIEKLKTEKEYRNFVTSLPKKEREMCEAAIWYTMTFEKEKALAIIFLKQKNL